MEASVRGALQLLIAVHLDRPWGGFVWVRGKGRTLVKLSTVEFLTGNDNGFADHAYNLPLRCVDRTSSVRVCNTILIICLKSPLTGMLVIVGNPACDPATNSMWDWAMIFAATLLAFSPALSQRCFVPGSCPSSFPSSFPCTHAALPTGSCSS
eukprot:1157499-Pelagomonas_calceolata.AAC.3